MQYFKKLNIALSNFTLRFILKKVILDTIIRVVSKQAILELFYLLIFGASNINIIYSTYIMKLSFYIRKTGIGF